MIHVAVYVLVSSGEELSGRDFGPVFVAPLGRAK